MDLLNNLCCTQQVCESDFLIKQGQLWTLVVLFAEHLAVIVDSVAGCLSLQRIVLISTKSMFIVDSKFNADFHVALRCCVLKRWPHH